MLTYHILKPHVLPLNFFCADTPLKKILLPLKALWNMGLKIAHRLEGQSCIDNIQGINTWTKYVLIWKVDIRVQTFHLNILIFKCPMQVRVRVDKTNVLPTYVPTHIVLHRNRCTVKISCDFRFRRLQNDILYPLNEVWVNLLTDPNSAVYVGFNICWPKLK